MKVTLPRKGLHEALQAGVRVVSTQTSLPVLKNVMLTAAEDSLRVSATDLEIALDQHLPAIVQESGSISVPAKTIADIVSSLAEADVTMAADDGRTLLVTCQAAETKLRGLPGEDFPPMPIVGEDLVLRAPEPFLREAIRLCVFAAASDDTRPILTAVRLELQPGQLTLVATDQHRLAHYRMPLSGEAGGDASGELQTVLAPARAMEDVGRLLDDDPEHVVELRADGNQISFKTDRFTLVSRVIEGRFPDYQRVMPTSHTIRARIQADPFLAALRRARILARDSEESRDRVVLDFADNRLTLISSGDAGGSIEELDVELEGDNIRVAFNVTYLLEVMDRLHCEAVNLDMTEPLLPAVLSPVDGPDYRMLLMPMHME